MSLIVDQQMPCEVQLRFVTVGEEPKHHLMVQILTSAGLVMQDSLRTVATWLQHHNYRYVVGSNALYVRQ